MSQSSPPVHSTLFSLPRDSVVTVGNFDGFHLGHQRIVGRAAAEAARSGLALVILTFSPHPRIHLGHNLHLIQTEVQRRESLRATAPDYLFVVPFARVVGLTAEAFIDEVLAGSFRARRVVVGEDFRFGRGRSGDRDFLAGHAAEIGLEVITVAPVTVAGERVSSSAIRHRLTAGDVAGAARLLGRPYALDGTVGRGAGRGRRLGFPTLNLETENRLLPPGVFFSRTGVAGREYDSLTHIGPAPTFHAGPTIETHVLDFDRQVYGEPVRIELLDKLRDVREFASAAELVAQLQADVAGVRMRRGRTKAI